MDKYSNIDNNMKGSYTTVHHPTREWELPYLLQEWKDSHNESDHGPCTIYKFTLNLIIYLGSMYYYDRVLQS